MQQWKQILRVHACVLVHLLATVQRRALSVHTHGNLPGDSRAAGARCPPHLPAWLRLPLATCLPLGLCLDGFLFPLPFLPLFHISFALAHPHSELYTWLSETALSYFAYVILKQRLRDLCSDSPHLPGDCSPPPFAPGVITGPVRPSREGPDPSSQPSIGGNSYSDASPGRTALSPTPVLRHAGAGDFSLERVDAPYPHPHPTHRATVLLLPASCPFFHLSPLLRCLDAIPKVQSLCSGPPLPSEFRLGETEWRRGGGQGICQKHPLLPLIFCPTLRRVWQRLDSF